MKTRKINKNDDDISASKGSNLDSKNEERVLGKLDKALQHFGKFDPTTKNPNAMKNNKVQKNNVPTN